MKLLAFDTSTSACTVGLLNGNQIKCLHKIAPMQQTKLIIPMIQELLQASSIKLNQLDAIACTRGPGSFTGIRIGISVIQAIGVAMPDIPIIPISTMAALAQTAYLNQGWDKLMVSIDARSGFTYWATYILNSLGYVNLIGEEEVLKPESINPPTDNDWYGVGDGWDIYHEELHEQIHNKSIKINSLQAPSAAALIALAKVKLEQKEWVNVNNVIPAYLR